MAFDLNAFSDSGFDTGQSGLPGYIADHFARILSRLPSQFRMLVDSEGERLSGPPNLHKKYRIIARQIQDIEDAAADLLVLRYLETAKGGQLDDIGRILGAGRDEWGQEDDGEYRRFLRLRTAQMRSKGRCSELLEIVSGLAVGCKYAESFEYPPSHFIMTFDGDYYDKPLFRAFVDKARRQAVSFELVNIVPLADGPFRLDDADPIEGLQGLGFPEDFIPDIEALSGSLRTIIFADPGGVMAGDFAGGVVTLHEGAAAGEVRTIDSSGLVATEGGFMLTVTEAFTEEINSSSKLDLCAAGGRLGDCVR